ncbi:hypothetical protein [Bacillus paralicheniformis]|uniref:hypothetical protein n=1 Tax=Bacillus paralicheniformis TaxID=1648923 RepID=UPI001CC809DA|nr:hypothetical protein [Bacillus paralicheniformis]UAY70618.1 hypothetical protein K8336_00555 [Bacillus paralicheniformis]
MVLLDWLVGDVVFDTVLFPSRASTFFLNVVSWLESLTQGVGQLLFVTSSCRAILSVAQIGDQFSGILNRFTVNLAVFFDTRFDADRLCIGVRFKETHITTEHFL